MGQNGQTQPMGLIYLKKVYICPSHGLICESVPNHGLKTTQHLLNVAYAVRDNLYNPGIRGLEETPSVLAKVALANNTNKHSFHRDTDEPQ